MLSGFSLSNFYFLVAFLRLFATLQVHMKVNITPKKEKSQVEMEISVPAEDFNEFIEKAAKKLSTDHSIKGFRPGKAPVKVIAEHFGHEPLLKEAMDAALPHFFVEAALEHEIEAISRPAISIKTLSLGQPLEFTAIVDVLPEVTLGDPTTIAAEKRPVEVTDEKIEQELQYIAKTRGTPIDVARPAQEGDTVVIDFAVRINGQSIEGGESKNHPVTLGEGRFVPDFEKGLTGISAGDTRQFPMEFPADYAKEDLRGKKAEVEVKAHSVQKRAVPDINDEFAKSLGKFESLAHLKKELKENMVHELESKERDRYFGELAEKLAEQASFGPLPDALVEKEIDNRLMGFAQMLAYQQKTLEQYLASENKTMEQMRADMRPAAEKNIKVGLTLRTFAKQQNIEVTETEIQEEVNKHLRQYHDVDAAHGDHDPQELRDHTENVIRNRRTLEKLAELVGSAKK